MNRDILRLAIPNILSNISVPLLSSVDTALMGQQADVAYLGAVGLGGVIFNFVYWSFGFLRMGTTGLTAQAYGKASDADIIHTLGRAVLFAVVGAAGLLLLQWPIGELSLWLLDAPTDVAPLVSEYFYIRIWAAPATLLLYAAMGWFFGLQNAVYPLILTLIVNAANIAMSYYSVYHLGMDVDGVAWATVIAQYIGAAVALGMFVHRYRGLLAAFSRRVVVEWQPLRAFFLLNSDIFIRTFCLIAAFTLFAQQSAAQGEVLLAVNTVLLQFLHWMSYAIDGFAYAAESLVGKYAGNRRRDQLARVITLTFRWGLGLALFFAALYAFGSEPLLWVFTDKPEVVDAALLYTWWMAIMPIVAFSCYLWDGIYVGLTASKAMRDSMLVSIVLFLLAVYTLVPLYGNNGLWLAMLLFMGVRGLVQWWMYRAGRVVTH